MDSEIFDRMEFEEFFSDQIVPYKNQECFCFTVEAGLDACLDLGGDDGREGVQAALHDHGVAGNGSIDLNNPEKKTSIDLNSFKQI